MDASERFLGKLKDVAEPEQKRKIIGAEFIRVFEEEARKLKGIDFLAQGTIYPDIVESGTKTAKVVKSHHNVGGLPDEMCIRDRGKVIYRTQKELPTHTALSDEISADLYKRGMRFVGSVIIYSYLQAVGIVNDHEPDCFLHTSSKACG